MSGELRSPRHLLQPELDFLSHLHPSSLDVGAAETALTALAEVFFQGGLLAVPSPDILPRAVAVLSEETRYRLLVEQLPAVVFMAYLDKGIGDAYVSPQIEKSLGYTQSEWLQDPIRWYARIHPEDKARWSTEAAEMFVSGTPLKSIYRVMARDGRVIWFQCEAKMIRSEDGRPLAIHGVGFDVTTLKNAERDLVRMQDKLLHDAFHDSLTSLPNRALFLDRLERAITRAKRQKNYNFAVLFVDIDRFKIVNDSLGHQAGDELIVEVCNRILQSLRLEDIVCRPVVISDLEWNTKDDTVARIGGDEFTVLLDDISDPRDSVRVADRIQNAFKEPIQIGGQDVFTSVSVGIASNTSQMSAAEILRNADTAMYRAKSRGKARCEVFDQAMHEEAIDRLKLETDLRRALEREEFRVYFQAIVSLEKGSISGFEALVRWERPGVGVVGPCQFITVAEEMGLIVPLGLWTFRKSCEQLRRWHALHPRQPALTMSVNVSGKQFAQNDFVFQVAKILGETHVEPGAIKLEITESVTMGHAERAVKVIEELKALGVQISIDDFGTGFSSLSYLRRFPIDTLKIDRSFVTDVDSDLEKQVIVRSIVGLAQNLGMNIVAEGTESLAEVRYLESLRCDFGQGYYFSHPVDCEHASALLSENRSFEILPAAATILEKAT